MEAFKILKESLKVPFLKYALGVAGVLAAASIVKGFSLGNFQFPLLTFFAVVGCMVILYVLGRVTREDSPSPPFVRLSGLILIYLTVFSVTLSCIVLFSVIVFQTPQHLYQWFSRSFNIETQPAAPVTMSSNVIPLTESKPTIIGIYPNDGFGILRKAGLHAFAQDHPEIRVVDLDLLSTTDMKNKDIKVLEENLRAEIAKSNVLAIVGPPITECTEAILEVVATSPIPPPVFLECAGARKVIGWEKHANSVPIFRISSGIERRANEIALFIKAALAKKTHIALIVEKSSTKYTYGEQLYSHIEKAIPDWQDHLNSGRLCGMYYPPGEVESRFSEIATHIKRPGIVLTLGLGADFEKLVKKFYNSRAQKPASKIGGWMNAYMLTKSAPNGLHFDQIFEITDFNFSSSGPPPSIEGEFTRAFGAPSPALRDQAFSFDAAYCIYSAYQSTKATLNIGNSNLYPRIDELFVRVFKRELIGVLHRGITGDIRFNTEDGQNIGGRLEYVQYSQKRNGWLQVPYSTLF